MPSLGGDFAHLLGERVADELYFITVTDPWYKVPGGNWEEPELANQVHSMGGIFAGIKNFRGGLRSTVAGSGGRPGGARFVGRMDRQAWLDVGRNVIAARKGVCTDCAAAAAYRLNQEIDNNGDTECRIEIISTGTHAFVVINREGDLASPHLWGEDACLLDVWFQNQSPKGDQAGCVWMTETTHGVVQFIRDNAFRLAVDVEIRGAMGALF